MNRLVCCLLLLLLFGCATGPTFYSESYLSSLGATEFSRLKRERTISKDPSGTAMVNRVSGRIAAAIGPEMQAASWEYVLFEDPAANAFALPGGKIAVFTGLLKHATTDDELAAVIGHEIAHVQLQHANQRMSAELLRGLGGLAAAYGTKDMSDQNRALVLAAYGITTQVGVMLPYSRAHESQADRLGLMIAARSGYDPRAALSFWRKMATASPSAVPEFLSTHPGYDTRLQTLQQAMPDALASYQQAKGLESRL